MTKQFEMYKCNVCGNMVEVLFSGDGELICCGEPMELKEEKTQKEGSEHHMPVFEKQENGETLVKVSKESHPMEKEHYIKFIEVFADDGILRKYLEVNQKPEFLVKLKNGIHHARALCNLHGLWKGENHVK